MRGKKKGFFFTLDAIIALGILVGGILFLYASYINEPNNLQPTIYANDLMTFLATTQVQELDNELVFNMWCEGGASCLNPTNEISNPENTLLEQMVVFVNDGNGAAAKNMLENITRGLISDQYGYAITLSAEGAATKVIINETRNETVNTRLYVSTREPVYIIPDKNTIAGPFIVTVHVWRRSFTNLGKYCTNGIKDGDETGTDCGGSCQKCGGGNLCNYNWDCASVICDGGKCTTPTCNDDVLNNEEEKTDCGGPNCGACG